MAETDSQFLPLPQALEEFRVKRYNSSSDDRYDTHVDVESPQSASRYLALLFYLNDDFTGGQTKFAEGPTIQPKRGTALVFPPYWMYPHAGLRVLTGTKYIMSTYLHLR
jgi:prolyl 4-hydroxylase